MNQEFARRGTRVLERLRHDFLNAHYDDEEASARFSLLYLGNGDEPFCCGNDETDQTKYRFWWPFNAVVEEASSELLSRGVEPGGSLLFLTIDPAPGDVTNVVIHTENRVLFMHTAKSWNFTFENDRQLALLLGEACETVLNRYLYR